MEELKKEVQILTERTGIATIVLQYYAFAHQSLYFMLKLWKRSRKMIEDNPFEHILEGVRKELVVYDYLKFKYSAKTIR